MARNGLRLYGAYVGGRATDRRVVWQWINGTVMLLLYGTHDIYRTAMRMDLRYDAETDTVWMDEHPAPRAVAASRHAEQPCRPRPSKEGVLFEAWHDSELAAFDFLSSTVSLLRRLNTEEELLELESELGSATVARAFNLLHWDHPEGELPQPITINSAIEDAEPDLAARVRSLEAKLAEEHAGRWFPQVEPAFLAEILRTPIEDWMVYLRPDQQAIVERDHDGPSRVLGPAGTGKTVVGLHRARELARRSRGAAAEGRRKAPLLFTTFVDSLPPVLEGLYRRMPGTCPGDVEFISVGQLAKRLCEEAGHTVRVPEAETWRLLSSIYERQVLPDTPLGDISLSEGYLRGEITKVIKGRGLVTVDEYLELDRTGRLVVMDEYHRTQVWEIMQAWDAAKHERGWMHHSDVVPLALGRALQLKAPRYTAAIVDEAQDLTLVGLKLLRALVNAPDHDIDRPNGLLILGDSGQRIYDGAYTLSEVGMDTGGRTTELLENYRNTKEIIEAANAVAQDVPVDDLDEGNIRATESAVLRSGRRPLMVRATGLDAQIEYILSRIDEITTESEGYGLGDIGILVQRKRDATAVLKRLHKRGCRAENLEQYRGRTTDAIKVGTYFRAKGLEFKAVFMPQVTRGVVPRMTPGAKGNEAQEAIQLGIRRLFVAMTRARDLLFVLYDREPSELLETAADHFERIDASRV